MAFMTMRLTRKKQQLRLQLPWINRLFFGAIFFSYLMAWFLDYSIPFLFHLFGFFAFLGLFYREQWFFNKENQTVEYRSGILWIWKKRIWDFSKVEHVFLICFIRGKKGYVDPSIRGGGLRNRQGLLKIQIEKEEHVLDGTTNRKILKLQEWGEAISSEIGCSFQINPNSEGL